MAGITNERMQRRLLSEKALTFARARELVLSMETVEQSAEEIWPRTPPCSDPVRTEESVNKATVLVTKIEKGLPPTPCYRCAREIISHRIVHSRWPPVLVAAGRPRALRMQVQEAAPKWENPQGTGKAEIYCVEEEGQRNNCGECW